MANFPPLKHYMFFCLERMIRQQQLQPPFLDVGCGRGDVSAFLAARGWEGVACDSSSQAIQACRANLARFPDVRVEESDVHAMTGTFRTIILWDCLEHIADDRAALKKIVSLLSRGGHLVLAVPTNTREWRWDDEFYGHYRRYSQKELDTLLRSAGVTPRLWWDFTFPFFWAMRRLAIRCTQMPSGGPSEKNVRTKESSVSQFWSIRTEHGIWDPRFFLWPMIYRVQFVFFKRWIGCGHETFVLAKKTI